MLIGSAALEKLKNSSVAVFGIGGVGGFTAEALARSGVGRITLIDGDTVEYSNINRQIVADTTTVGEKKTDVLKARILKINPEASVDIINEFITPDNVSAIDFSAFNYVVDAVDTVSAKLSIIESCIKAGVKIISCMGTGGKLDITRLKVAPIEKTFGCPLAKVMRRELSKRGIVKVKTVFSDEGFNHENSDQKKADGKSAPPSMIFVPAAAGLLLAAEVVKDLKDQR